MEGGTTRSLEPSAAAVASPPTLPVPAADAAVVESVVGVVAVVDVAAVVVVAALLPKKIDEARCLKVVPLRFKILSLCLLLRLLCSLPLSSEEKES